MRKITDAKIDDWWIRKKISQTRKKKKKNLSILWKRADIELQSVSVHYERLKTSPSLMLRLVYLHRFTSSGVILWGTFHAAVAFAPFLLILLKSGPTDDETFLPFSGSLWNRFLIFFRAEKTVRSLGLWFRGVCRSAYHISRYENKRHDHFQKMSSTYHVLCNTRRMKWGSFQDVRPCQSLAGRVSLIHARTGGEIIINMLGFSVLFSEAAWWWRREQLSNSPLTVKHKVSGSERGTPTFISFTAAPPVALKET